MDSINNEISEKREIIEMTRRDILVGASPEPWKTPMNIRIQGYSLRLKEVNVSYKDRTCIVVFTTSKIGHTTQDVYVSLEDFWDMYEANESSEKKVSLSSLLNTVIMQGETKVFCSCPSWIYGGYKYMGTQLDYAYMSPETRFPKIRNPRLQGTVCKHLFVVLKALPYQKFGIESLLRKELSNVKIPASTAKDDSQTEKEENNG